MSGTKVQWFDLRLPSCSPGFESLQALPFRFNIVYLNDSILLIEFKKNENNLKRGRCLFIFFGNTIDSRASPKRDTFRAFNGHVYIATSVTRFGDFLDFGQLFKAFCSN